MRAVFLLIEHVKEFSVKALLVSRINDLFAFDFADEAMITPLISGLRSFDIIRPTTAVGPGLTNDVIVSVIHNEYQAEFCCP